MFKIYDGRKEFYQWDLDRKLIVSDPTINEVHFCNKTDDCSLVCEVYEEDGLHLVNVPNLLLQSAWPIRVYGYCGNCYTKQYDLFKVNTRSKPADYMYTETEIKTWATLDSRMDAIEEMVSVENIAQTVKDYLKENPVEVPEEYVTEAELDAKGYLTEHQSLEGYALKTDIPDTSKFITAIPSEYITESELNSKKFATEGYVNNVISTIPQPDLSAYALKTDIPDVTGYQTEEQVNALINTALGVIENGTY